MASIVTQNCPSSTHRPLDLKTACGYCAVLAQLAPVIESVDVVLQCNSCGFEMRNRSDDIARSHLTCGIVIEADAQYPRARSTHRPCVRSPCKRRRGAYCAAYPYAGMVVRSAQVTVTILHSPSSENWEASRLRGRI